jgi:N-glycosylase/DNA lyase
MTDQTAKNDKAHKFNSVSTSTVKEKGKSVADLPHPQFSLDEKGLENARAYYGSIGTLVHNLNRIIKTDSRNDYSESVGLGKSRDAILKERGYVKNSDGTHTFSNFTKGLGIRKVADELTYWLNRAKNAKLTAEQRLEAMEMASSVLKARTAKLTASADTPEKDKDNK